MKATALGHIITKYVNSKGVDVSPKKLQKLVYYVEAWHLVHFKSELIEENFEAWVHGPVVPELYQNLKQFGYNDIQILNDELDSAEKRIQKIAKENNINEDQLDLIYSVLNKYGTLSSFELEMLTHSEEPWIEARKGLPPHERCTNVIPKNRMKEYYSAQLAA
ncbi:MAG: Panacea domain-containing protein [Marinirhabdus sp.]